MDHARRNSRLECILVTALVTVFGSGSWISVAGIWVELPILIASGLPEQYRITSIVNILIQCSILGMVGFWICDKVLASTRVYRPEIPINYLITLSGTIGTFLLIFFWDSWVYWSGEPHSLAFLILLFFVALVDITSNVTFVGYMTILKPNFMNWFLFGSGLSHVIPGFIGLIQISGGTSKGSCVANFTFINETFIGNTSVSYNCTAWQDVPPKFIFGPRVYFGFMFLIMLSCHVSFICLNTLPSSRREYAPQADGHHLRTDGCGGLFTGRQHTSSPSNDDDEEEGGRLGLLSNSSSYEKETLIQNEEPTQQASANDLPERQLSFAQVVFVYSTYVFNFTISFGVMDPILGYFGSAYGSTTFQVIVPLQQLCIAVSYFAFLVKPIYSFKAVGVSLAVALLGFTYQFVVACTSPHPPMDGLLIGKILSVLVTLVASISTRYCHAANVWIQRNSVNSRKHLIITGALSQIGVTIGSIIMFVLVNVYNVFVATEEDGSCRTDMTCVEI